MALRTSVRPGRARVGTCGWQFDDWRGVLYPEHLGRSRWLAAYATQFDTVEVDSTFYGLPSPETVARWAASVPGPFAFSVKVGGWATHRKHLRDPEDWLPHHLAVVEALGPHLGPQLVQLPPHWRRDAARLDALLDLTAATAPEVHWAVEVRDESWLHDEVFEVLDRHAAALVVHDLLDVPWVRTAPFAYVRFHRPGTYGGTRLWRPADRLAEWRDEGTDVWAYFNNDAAAAAVHDARWLARRLGAVPLAA